MPVIGMLVAASTIIQPPRSLGLSHVGPVSVDGAVGPRLAEDVAEFAGTEAQALLAVEFLDFQFSPERLLRQTHAAFGAPEAPPDQLERTSGVGYSESPAASRAWSRSMKTRTRLILPFARS
jgi:hypothetical protein